MRVLTMVHSLNMGGIEVTLLRYLPQLHQAGIEIDIACSSKSGSLESRFTDQGVNLHEISSPKRLLTTAFQTWRLARHYDIIHSRYGYNAAAHVLGAFFAGKPSVVSFHNDRPSMSILGWKGGYIAKLLLGTWLLLNSIIIRSLAQRIVGHSISNLESFWPRWTSAPERYDLLINGICFPDTNASKEETKKMIGVPKEADLVLHVGSFKKEKNHILLLDIFERILQKRPNAKLVMVGDGVLRPGLQSLAEARNLTSCVLFAGRQADVSPYFKAADLFLFPSLSEGYGNVLAEAQSVGLPIVASDIPPHREAVAPCQHRFLFKLDEPKMAASLAEVQLTATQNGSNEWVGEARDLVRSRNSVTRSVSRLVEIYQSLHQADSRQETVPR